MSSRHLIVHGHFYQPPRENPWIMSIEPQPSAAPFENWNRRINRECYAPNARARLMSEGRIKGFLNNYEHMSFNFGPTLLSWLEKDDPETLAAIVQADRRAAERMGGHGPALAQVFNHIIMPLAEPRDRLTQIRWGLADFERHFGRRPEGMWLAEAAVDLETLGMLAREGLKFTILSQGQAATVRPLAARDEAPPEPRTEKDGTEEDWLDVSGGRIDPREPYRVFWGPGPGDFLDVFFYDGPVSRAIAFEKLLSDGPALLRRVEDAFGEPLADGGPRLVNLATDGESYGHHFTFGEMALAWLFDHLLSRAGEPDAIQPTNHGAYLAFRPPTREARIFEDSSWSCAHGVERWRDDCGCNTGGGGGTWNQKWRRPLRDGLDWLRARLAEIFEREGGRLLKDPWRARDEYILLPLNRYAPALKEAFLAAHALKTPDSRERREIWALLEAQLMSLYMFTSCGWFFDDIAGLEPVQNLRYAMRAIEMSRAWAETDLQGGLLDYLELIKPNAKDYATGRELWRRQVETGALSGRAIAAHWAAAALLDAPQALTSFIEPRFENRALARLTGEELEILAGLLELADDRLERTDRCLFLAIYSGGVHLAVVSADMTEGASPPEWLSQQALRQTLKMPLTASNSMRIWDALYALMPRENISRHILDDLLPHCRQAIISTLTGDVLAQLKEFAEDLFHLNQYLLTAGRSPDRPPDWAENFIFQAAMEAEFRRILSPAKFGRPINLGALAYMFDRRRRLGLAGDAASLEETGRIFIDDVFRGLKVVAAHPGPLLSDLMEFIGLAEKNDFKIDLWSGQNQWLDLAGDQAFLVRLSPEDQELMAELGLALGFAPSVFADRGPRRL